MDREVAQQIIDVTRRMDELLHEIHVLLHDVEDRDERKGFIKGLLRVVTEAHECITLPIARQHPELHPDNVESGWTYNPASPPPGKRR